MLRLACQAVSEADSRSRDTIGGRVVAVAVTLVPPSLPLADLPPTFDQTGNHALARAKEISSRELLRDGEIETRLTRAYDTARAIVSEAAYIGADAIFLALDRPRFSWLPLRLSSTARRVMKQAPCPVFLGYFPHQGALEASTASAEAERLLRHAS
jgi:nucleotide-binding universal stress UspA family protein